MEPASLVECDLPDRRESSRDAASRILVVVRLVCLVVIAITAEGVPLAFGAHLDHPLLEVTLAVAGAYALFVAWWTFRKPSASMPGLLPAVLDVLLLCALTYESGGPMSQAKKVFFVIPVAAAMLRKPRVTAGWTIVAVGAFVAITIGNRAAEGPAGALGVYAYAGYLALVGGAATTLSWLLSRERDHILQLAVSRRKLLAWTLSAEDRTRAQLAYQLHDGPVQNLHAALRLLGRAHDGELSALDRCEDLLRASVQELRHTIFELSPPALAQSGLVGAIRAIVADAAQERSLEIVADLDERATGTHDEVLFACARELITNVVKHAQARHVWISLRQHANEIVLTVIDDGIGLTSLPASAPGHLGLAAMRERVEVVDGHLALRPSRSSGTHIVLRLPRADTYPLELQPIDSYQTAAI